MRSVFSVLFGTFFNDLILTVNCELSKSRISPLKYTKMTKIENPFQSAFFRFFCVFYGQKNLKNFIFRFPSNKESPENRRGDLQNCFL